MAKRPRKAKLLSDQYPTHYLPNVGRQVMADGGVPEVEGDVSFAPPEVEARQAYNVSPVIDQNIVRTAREALERNRDRPFENASDFVRHQLNKDEPQLPQYDRENVRAWQEGAKELAHIGAYGIPVIGEGLAAYDLANAARDVMSPEFREAVKNRDYLSSGATLGGLGLAAFGAPGRLAKAAAAAGAVMMPQEAQSGVVDRALKAIRAYHGSPHKFDRFDISKIGTGEGAQAYGHGLYFAENPEVAHAYREALSPYGRGDRPEDIAARVLHATRGDRDAALAELRNRADTSLQAGGSYEGAQRLMEARNIVNTNPEVAGHMYEVGIRANPEHLIDWDKPIADQPHVVRGLNQYVDEMGGEQQLKDFSKELEEKRRAEDESFARLWESDQPTDLSDMMTYFNKNKYSSKEALTDLLNNIRKGEEPVGAEFYRSLAPQEYDYKGATETAQRLGIPGLQYLDRLSRGAGTGSRNYVMFDPNLIDITRRYADGGIVKKALQAIRAYHGSPHKFDKFDINKIGTGEGVQAYGHGLYFSGNEDVAKAYAENAEDKYAPGIIARRMLAGWPDRDTAIQKQMERIARLEQSHNEEFIAPYRGALDLLKSGEIPKAGHMYEVDIHANPEHLLDWHKRLHEQTPHVQANLKDMAQDVGLPMKYWSPVNPEEAATGEEYYSSLAQRFKNKKNPIWDPKEASSELKNWALPGIKYLDPASRGAGAVSSNYVLFDPNLIDITRRYSKGGDVEGYDKGGAIAKVLGKLMAPGSGYAPRKGFPELVNLPGIGKVESRPIPEIESIARRFAGEAHDADVTPLNPEFSKRVAQEYDVMRHDPQDPIVRRAFQALADETMQQYRAAKDLGLDIKFLKPGQADPYAASPALGYEDIVNRGRLFVYPTEAGFGSTGGINASNVLLKGAGRVGDKEDAVVNDAFRVIHDLFGHFGPGNAFFRAPGEERAFQLHKRMFSPEARPALTSETRGQNSWVNFGEMAERNRAAKGADTYYADQKTGLMPDWTMANPPSEGVNVDEYIRSLPHKDKGGAIAKALQAAARVITPSEKMGVIHGISDHLLPRLKELGAFPSPSMAITKPLLDNSNFGNITFVGRKHLAEPSETNPIFGQDAFTPRFPYIDNRSAKTFYSDAHDNVVPLTLENVLEHMQSRPLIGGENWRHDQDRVKELGVIMAEQAPAFKTLDEIKNARDNIVPMHEWKEKAEALENEHERLANLLHWHANEKLPYDRSSAQGYFGDALGSRNIDEWRSFYPGAPQEDIDAAMAHLENIRKMPAMYFEGKPQRAVGFNEFAGAVVPEATYKNVSPILRDMGIKDISTYAAPFERRGERISKDFGEHMFADGGTVNRIPRADDEQFFRRLALWTYSVSPLFSNTHQLSQNRLGYDKGGVIAKAIKAASNLAKEEMAAPAIVRPLDELFPGASKRYAVPGEPSPAIDKQTGNPYLKKELSPEGDLVLKARQAAQKAINKGDFKPYFDPAERFDVNVGDYAPYQSTLDIRRVQPATQEKYEALARAPEATERLQAAYKQGLGQAADAGNWYHMGQLQDEFIKQYGPELGRDLFKERFADAMAATTGGADPTTNLMMAHYGNYLKNRGEKLPEETYNFPYPIGGRFAGSNMDQYRQMILEGQGIGHDNPKRYNFSYNFLGEPRGATLDEQMSNIFDPKMNMPPAGTYGHYEGALHDIARKYGVDPRYFQEVAWAGGKDLKAIEKNKPRYKAQPMIQNVNEAIERTSRITGLPPAAVVERGLVRAEMPLYQDGGAVIDRALDVVSKLPHARA